MRPYNFRFVGRNGQVETEYLIDLDKICAIEQAYFETDEGLAYLPVIFQGSMDATVFRFMTEYVLTDPHIHSDSPIPLEKRKEIMQKTQEDFTQTVEVLKAAWTSGK